LDWDVKIDTSKSTTSVSARTTVRLPEDLHHRAKLVAAWSGTKLQEFIAEAVEQYLVSAEAAMDHARSRAAVAAAGRKH
jgi:predicted HicB family RNase H-like nuclease